MSATPLALDSRRLVLADVVPAARFRDVVLVLAGAALTALLAQVSIPMPPSPVPITGQTLAVVLVGASLGSRRGAAALGLYVLAGMALPVYAEGKSGSSVLFGATGGYLVGFVLAAFAIGWIAERGGDRRVVSAVLAGLVGQLLVFGIGVPWLKVSAGMDWGTAIHDGFAIFIVGGIVKALIAGVALPSAWRLARRVDRR
jgi:biotin transport system substrate-specific component